MTSGWCGEVGAGQQSCCSEDRRVSAGTWIQTGVTPAAGRGIAPAPKRGSPPAMAGTPAAGARRSACWPVSASCSKIRLRWRGSGLNKTRTTRSGDGASPRRFTAARPPETPTRRRADGRFRSPLRPPRHEIDLDQRPDRQRRHPDRGARRQLTGDEKARPQRIERRIVAVEFGEIDAGHHHVL